MTPFRRAALVRATASGIELALDAGWRCRVAIVAPGIGRVLMLPPSGLREPRTWSVLNGADPWQGAERLGLFGNAAPATMTHEGDAISLRDGLLRARITLSPFGLAWDQSGDVGQTWQSCCADRPTFAYANAEKSGALGHWQARDEHDQYFGLGDKTGPLDHLPIFVRAWALLPMTASDSDARLTEEPSRLLRYYPPPSGAATSSAELFEDDGLQTGFAAATQTLHRFSARAEAGALTIEAQQTGDWPLPYGEITVALPGAERRPLTLRPDRVPLVRS